eukprot:TRINITY_DN102482_c0_g1_i1.p1 TRINITY_DN102482_c0_g1~~TRINITY_DN102482_c0_g1_i1.p1  ORF type:complete len:112 (-),score=1.24 TRINITY_DN102482_c0_g1_i1:90-425(-)
MINQGIGMFRYFVFAFVFFCFVPSANASSTHHDLLASYHQCLVDSFDEHDVRGRDIEQSAIHAFNSCFDARERYLSFFPQDDHQGLRDKLRKQFETGVRDLTRARNEQGEK